MIDLDKLEEQREAAGVDKADLFDFYHKNWPLLVGSMRVGLSVCHEALRRLDVQDRIERRKRRRKLRTDNDVRKPLKAFLEKPAQ